MTTEMKNGKCPRRNETDHEQKKVDVWRDDNTCSFCGSIHPDDVIAHIKAGKALSTTDKTYKVYIEGDSRIKAYFQHFEGSHKDEFIKLFNEKKIKFGGNIGFQPWPFFMKPVV